jgi:hypothetical protein
LVAIDGTGIAVPDSDANRAWTDKTTASHPAAGYPLLRLVTLVECGTRALIAAVFGTPAEGELAYAAKLGTRLRPGMMLLADRNFDAATFLTHVAATGADLLIRLKANRRPPLLGHHPDGSITSLIGGTQVRIIEARITVTGADGSRRSEHYRLVTTLLDPEQAPAIELAELYAQRWEFETALDELKTHQRGAKVVLRSKSPEVVEQEVWGFLLVHCAIRELMHTAALDGDVDPDRVSFIRTLRLARRTVTEQAAFSP